MAIAWFLEQLAEFGAGEAIVRGGRSSTYDDLLAKVGEYEKMIATTTPPIGPIVAVDGHFSLETTALFLALMNRDLVYVPLGPC